jgi:hypothetical protein
MTKIKEKKRKWSCIDVNEVSSASVCGLVSILPALVGTVAADISVVPCCCITTVLLLLIEPTLNVVLGNHTAAVSIYIAS